MPEYEFLKGHGTENDFVLLPDHDGTIHRDLTADAMAARVRALCDRHAGIGGDGVLRVVRDGDGWFMDYRNADGSLSEMCGNGIRVFARYLVEEGLVDAAEPFWVDTRDGRKLLDRAETSDSQYWYLDSVVRERADKSLEYLFSLLAVMLPAEPLKAAFRGLHGEDRMLRGLALEFLELHLTAEQVARLRKLVDPAPAVRNASAGAAATAL